MKIGIDIIYTEGLGLVLRDRTSTLSNCNSKEQNLDISKLAYVEKLSITGILSQFLIPKIGIIRTRLLSLSLISFGYILLFYCFSGEHPYISLLSILSIISCFSLMSLRKYYMFRICKNCGRELAYVMTREPEIKGDSPETITSYYACKYCGHKRVEVEIVVRGYDFP